MILAVRCCDADHVVLVNVFERAEKGVAMGRDAHVARLARKRGRLDVSRGVLQVALAYAFHDHHLQMQTRNRQPSDNSSGSQ